MIAVAALTAASLLGAGILAGSSAPSHQGGAGSAGHGAAANTDAQVLAPQGYSLVAADGGVFTFDGAAFHGSTGGTVLDAPIVGMASDPATGGYWLVGADGGIFAFDAPFLGSMGGHHLNAAIVGMAATTTGKGYWLVAADGGIFAFGSAAFHGSMGGRPLNLPVVGMAATTTGKGYWLVAADGGIFTFGSAAFHGSTGGMALNAPIVGMAGDPASGGYWLVTSDGGIFAFGAPFLGSMGGHPLGAPIVGMADAPTGNEYWLAGAGGGISAFGDDPFDRSMGSGPLNAPIVGISAASGAPTSAGSPTSGPGTTASPPVSGTPALAPATPPVRICGNATELAGPNSAPAGAVLVPAGTNATPLAENWEITPNTVYYLASGVHTLGTTQFAQIDPADGDTFLGAPGAVLNGQAKDNVALGGTATDVTIEYLTITDFVGPTSTQNAVNHTGAPHWTLEHDTIETTTIGGGLVLGTTDTVEYDCLTGNAQYGFSAFPSTTTTGATGSVTLSYNEISDNDGTTAGGGQYDQPGSPYSCGCSGGGKFWDMNDATVTFNYVHNNGDVAIWVDTDNRGFDISHNYISTNWGAGIMYEISYNALISDNTLVRDDIGTTHTNGFPTPTIYISESGGDVRVHSNYAGQLTVTGNVLTNNWGGVILWENSNRYCGDGSDNYCTLVTAATYSISSCTAHLHGATPGQVPDYYDNCRWKTQNVTVSDNAFNLTPSAVGPGCTEANWCGFNGLFSEWGTTTPWPEYAVSLHISDDQNNRFENNIYSGPWHFDAFALGTRVTWTEWTQGFTNAATSGDRFDARDQGSIRS